jgi:cell division protein ZapA (FtsZ GTPase activity inhibitor)
MSARTVNIHIRGRDYRLRTMENTDTHPDQDIDQAARFMDEVAASLDPEMVLPEDKLFFLTAINLALQLAKERRTRSSEQERISSLVRRVEQCL